MYPLPASPTVPFWKNPACADIADLFRKGRALAAKNKKKEAEDAAAAGKKKGATSGGKLDGQVDAAAATPATAVAAGKDGCPLDKGELGAATWGLVRQAGRRRV